MGITARINDSRRIPREKKNMNKLFHIKTKWLIIFLWIVDKLLMFLLFNWSKGV